MSTAIDTILNKDETEKLEFYNSNCEEHWFIDIDDICCAECRNAINSPFEEDEKVCGIDKLKPRIKPDGWCKEWKAGWSG